MVLPAQLNTILRYPTFGSRQSVVSSCLLNLSCTQCNRTNNSCKQLQSVPGSNGSALRRACHWSSDTPRQNKRLRQRAVRPNHDGWDGVMQISGCKAHSVLAISVAQAVGPCRHRAPTSGSTSRQPRTCSRDAPHPQPRVQVPQQTSWALPTVGVTFSTLSCPC